MPTKSKTVSEFSHTFATVHDFLITPTPDNWLNWAVQNIPALLWDHGSCEKKAASSAISLLYRYPQNEELTYRMSRLAREELRHYEQVRKIIRQREIEYIKVPAARYTARLRAGIRTSEPERLVDTLVVGAFIEARSCERFEKLLPHLDQNLARFYGGLMESESRHFHDYLNLAANETDAVQLQARVDFFRDIESAAIVEPDQNFAFHSGPPA